MSEFRYDVVVAGAGNAALCAALSARESEASVLVLERAPEHGRGGNSLFTAGLVRFPYQGIEEVRALIPDMTDEEAASIEVGHYTEEEFYADLARITEYQADPELAAILTAEAFPAMRWMAEKGIRFGLALRRQAFKVGQKFRFWGNAPVEFVGGGPGLVDGLLEAARKNGIEVWYCARARKLIVDETGAVCGIRLRRDGTDVDVRAGAVVLATGGFEANPEMRAKYLGPNWDVVKVRGTEFNTGDGILMALEVGAQPYGNWSGCHAVAWDANAPPTGDRKVGDGYQKHSYPFGIIVNKLGKRFVDEGADFRNYTYAMYGKEILRQPGRLAFQVFDSKVVHLLREEYRIREVTKAEAHTLEELADALGIHREGFVRAVREFNAAVMKDRTFEPTILDGKGTVGIDPPKSNWALPVDSPPYLGYAVTCGITFTFGGLRLSERAEVLDLDNRPIPGLTAAGELVGGLFYHNYPGGTGLTSGAVFGRIAGRTAAEYAKKRSVNGEQ
ncbi:MAG: FAD-dependent tricarballylate dehydrogenase TcuA [Gemmatimonadetes bacterium]|nr:FAD-dependent tricarballylate dehydrogenase TcuA [Gemmatimonadota bacterium]